MDPILPWFYVNLTRLLLDFATMQGNAYVTVVSSNLDWQARKFGTALTRRTPARVISKHGLDTKRMHERQAQYHNTH